MRLPDGETLFFGSLGTLIVIGFTALLSGIIAFQFTANEPTYCYVVYSATGENDSFPYQIGQHRPIGSDLKLAVAKTAKEAAEIRTLLCR